MTRRDATVESPPAAFGLPCAARDTSCTLAILVITGTSLAEFGDRREEQRRRLRVVHRRATVAWRRRQFGQLLAPAAPGVRAVARAPGSPPRARASTILSRQVAPSKVEASGRDRRASAIERDQVIGEAI
jgi:hypothetical protein